MGGGEGRGAGECVFPVLDCHEQADSASRFAKEVGASLFH